MCLARVKFYGYDLPRPGTTPTASLVLRLKQDKQKPVHRAHETGPRQTSPVVGSPERGCLPPRGPRGSPPTTLQDPVVTGPPTPALRPPSVEVLPVPPQSTRTGRYRTTQGRPTLGRQDRVGRGVQRLPEKICSRSGPGGRRNYETPSRFSPPCVCVERHE